MNPDLHFDQQSVIRSIVERYFNAVDRRDYELLTTCFTQDVEVEFNLDPKIVVHDRDELIAFMQRFPHSTASSHGLSNISVLVEGDTASAVTFAVVHAVIGPVDGGPILIRGLRYDDQLRREGGTWRICRRSHNPLWQYETTVIRPRVPPKS
jgi:hypothetical protein